MVNKEQSILKLKKYIEERIVSFNFDEEENQYNDVEQNI